MRRVRFGMRRSIDYQGLVWWVLVVADKDVDVIRAKDNKSKS